MVRLSDYLEAAYNAMQGIADKVYLDRPDATSDSVNSYIVVASPNYVSNREIDPMGGLDYYVGTINIYAYVKDKPTSKATKQSFIKRIDTLSCEIQQRFPVVDRDLNVKLHKPRVVMSSSDGEGWHYVLITTRLTTYF